MPLRPTTVPFASHSEVKRTLLVALAALVLLATPAHAHDGDARATGSCGRGASTELRVKADDGALEVELRVRRSRPRERWSVALIHERRVAWRGVARTSRSRDGFRVRRTLPDYSGADEISARATNPRGLTCQATVTLRG